MVGPILSGGVVVRLNAPAYCRTLHGGLPQWAPCERAWIRQPTSAPAPADVYSRTARNEAGSLPCSWPHIPSSRNGPCRPRLPALDPPEAGPTTLNGPGRPSCGPPRHHGTYDERHRPHRQDRCHRCSENGRSAHMWPTVEPARSGPLSPLRPVNDRSQEEGQSRRPAITAGTDRHRSVSGHKGAYDMRESVHAPSAQGRTGRQGRKSLIDQRAKKQVVVHGVACRHAPTRPVTVVRISRGV